MEKDQNWSQPSISLHVGATDCMSLRPYHSALSTITSNYGIQTTQTMERRETGKHRALQLLIKTLKIDQKPLDLLIFNHFWGHF